MQGQRSTITTYSNTLSFNHSSSSNDVTADSQILWNNMQSSVQNQLPDYRLPSSETNIQCLQHVRHDTPNAEWSLGETSSGAAQHQGDRNERKAEHTWAFYSQAAPPMDEPPRGPPNIPTMDNTDVHSNINQTGNGPFHSKNASSGLTQDLNVSSGFGDQEDDAFQVAEQPSTYISVGASNGIQSGGGSSTSFGGPNSGEYGMNNEEQQPGSFDGQHFPCKRKALELQSGQSSGAGSSSSFQNAERSQWHTAPPVQIAASNVNMATQTENDPLINNGRDQGNQRLRLSIGAVPASPLSLTPTSGNAESSHRNVRLRMNSFHQQEPVVDGSFSMEVDVGNAVASSSRHSSRSTVRNHYLDLNPPPELENGNLQGQAVQHVPAVYRNGQSRWTGTSSARTRPSSSVISDDWNIVPYEGSSSRTIPRGILEHPMFSPANDLGNTSQGPVNWNLAGGNSNVAGNVGLPPRIGPSSGANYVTPLTHRNSRRLSEIVRRTLLSSAGTEYGSQSSSHGTRTSSSAAYQEIPLPRRAEHHRALNPRSLLDRHASLAVPYSLRTLAAAGEGRSNAMSESYTTSRHITNLLKIRHVLDLMRRGEGLRFEDVMILNHSVLFGMADIHDRHRDMRLDVDNMSYEELLALEERIGNVCTGLSEETIVSHMKQHKFVDLKIGQMETEPCSICQEEYNVGEDIGTLNCGHDFHRDCIKQWLVLKNLCPICKTTGLTT